MITGLSSEIATQLPGASKLPASKETGLIFGNVLDGIIKDKESAPVMQDESSISFVSKDMEERDSQEATEQNFLNLFTYRTFQDGQPVATGKNVSADEEADRTSPWMVNVEENQHVITAKLDYAVSATEISTKTRIVEVGGRIEQILPLDTISITRASESQSGNQASNPESIGIMKSGEKEHFMTENEQVDFFSEETKNPVKQAAANNTVSGTQMRAEDVIKETITMPKDSKMKQTDRVLLLQEKNSSDQSLTSFPEIPATEDAGAEGNLTKQSSELQTKDQPEVVAKVSDSDGSKAQFNQGPFISKLNTSNVFGHKPLKITASHIEDIQKAIELQIEKTTDLGSTVVKIRLTPDNIGDIHVQLIKTEDSITAILHVQNAETKGLLEEQLPLLMEPFKHSVSESPLTLNVVADSNLAFSFSEGADSDNRKSERQEARKRTTKEKTETKDQPKMNQSISGLSLLA